MLCQPSRATIATGTFPSTHGVTCNGIDLPEHWADKTISAYLGRAGYETAIFGKAHFASVYPFVPTGRAESVEGSAYVPEDWEGPYFGFEHAELILFGHNLRMAPLQGNWNWCFGPSPMGLHYGRYLFRDGPERGRERLAQMQPEYAGATWDHTQTWASSLPEEDHPTTWVADRAIEWLNGVSGDFFVWVSFTDPHHPMDPPSRGRTGTTLRTSWRCCRPHTRRSSTPSRRSTGSGPRATAVACSSSRTREARTTRGEELARMTAGYYGMVSQLDFQIGRVLAVLDERGLRDDTLVLVTTDHGELLGHHQMIFKGPLHYDDLLRVPLIANGPGFVSSEVRDDPVGTIDIAPTALTAAGVDLPDQLEGAPLQTTGDREHTLTENDFDIVIKLRLRTLTTRDWKVTRYEDTPEVGELYALSEDPDELVNRWDDGECAPIRAELLEALDATMNHDAHSEPKVGIVG